MHDPSPFIMICLLVRGHLSWVGGGPPQRQYSYTAEGCSVHRCSMRVPYVGASCMSVPCVGASCMHVHCVGVPCLRVPCVGVPCVGVPCVRVPCVGASCMSVHCVGLCYLAIPLMHSLTYEQARWMDSFLWEKRPEESMSFHKDMQLKRACGRSRAGPHYCSPGVPISNPLHPFLHSLLLR